MIPKEQSPFVVYDSQANMIQPAPATHKCVRGVSHCMEEHQRRPLESEGFDCNLVPEGLERTRHGPIIPFDPGIGEPEDICVRAVEKTICRTRIQSRRQFHASITVNQPYGDEYSGGGLLIRKFRVEIQ